MKKAILLLFLFSCVGGYSCNVVIAWNGDKILVGNNEDWFDLNAKYWYEPVAEKHKYGAVFFGFKKDGKFAHGGDVKSVYSNVFDLTNKRIDNYYLYDFTKSHLIDLGENVNCDANRTYLFKDIFQKRFSEVKASQPE
jgi:hypothetical protein